MLPLTAPFTIGTSGLLTSSPPGVAYSSGSNEFLVAWTDGLNNIRGQRVDASGAKVGAVIPVAMTSLWEGFPSMTYNSAQNEYLVGYYFETATGASSVGTQRVKPGTGALIGGRSMLYSGGFNQYPELAYNSATNQYLAISWGYSGGSWMIRGRLADGNSQPLGASTLALAAKGGGDGIGLGYNPVSNTYLADYQSQTNAETWGVEIGAAGAPGTQTQLSVSGTTLSVQPRAKARASAAQWLMVDVERLQEHHRAGGGPWADRAYRRGHRRWDGAPEHVHDDQSRVQISSASMATGFLARALAAQPRVAAQRQSLGQAIPA